MKNTFCLICVIVLLMLNFNANCQIFNPHDFNVKLGLAELLLKKQPAAKELPSVLPKEFKIDSLQKTKYFLKDSFGNAITIFLHIETLKIVYIEFYEKPIFHKDLYACLQNQNYVWIGSEHNCDYLNNKKLSIVICPGMENWMMINISKYDL